MIRGPSFTAFLPLAALAALAGPGAAHDSEPSGSTVTGQYEDCLALADSYEKTICLEPYFQALTNEQSAAAAIARARELKDQGVISDCHLVAHIVGEANLRKFDFQVGRALGSCSMDCIQGCVHGVMQTYVSEKIAFEELESSLKGVCDGIAGDALLRHQCVHGVGHGFLTGGYLPIDAAIQACHHFQGPEAQTCLGGLFMENMQQYLLISEAELRQELPGICAGVVAMENQGYTDFCHDAIGEGLMFYTSHNLARSLALCNRVSLRIGHQELCKRAAIVEAGNAPARFDPAACDQAPARLREACRNLF